ncbi:MAG: hypothetical protein WC479_04570 [Candidatus Izemoplasmatales bacterium]
MLNTVLTDKLKALVKNIDIGVTVANNGEVIYLLPYDKDTRLMTLEGTTEEEKIASFIEQINSGLDTMISHLNDCKILESQRVQFVTRNLLKELGK